MFADTAPRWLETTAANQSAACNGTIISDTESKGMGEVIQLQGDHRSKIKDFLVDQETGLALDEKTIKVRMADEPAASSPTACTNNRPRSTASKSGMSAVLQLSGPDP